MVDGTLLGWGSWGTGVITGGAFLGGDVETGGKWLVAHFLGLRASGRWHTFWVWGIVVGGRFFGLGYVGVW